MSGRHRSRSPPSGRTSRHRDDRDDRRREHGGARGSSRRESRRAHGDERDEDDYRGRHRREKPRKAKKEKKAKKSKTSYAPDAAFGGYTNQDNPFGDSKLHDVFVWHKKHEREVAEGVRTAAPSKEDLLRHRETLVDEIAAVKRRQEVRAAEKRERDRLRAEEDRLREAEAHAGYASKEDAFHLAQVTQRCEIRIRDGREKCVDVLAKNLVIWGRAHSVELLQAEGKEASDLANPLAGAGGRHNHMTDVVLEPPHAVLAAAALPLATLQELQREVAEFVDAEGLRPGGSDGNGLFATYWRCVGVLVQDALQRERARLSGDSKHTGPGGVPGDVAADVEGILGAKSVSELVALEADVKQRAARVGHGASGGAGDAGFWVHVLTAVAVYQAQAQAQRVHETVLKLRLGQLQRAKQEQAGAAASGAGADGDANGAIAAAAAALATGAGSGAEEGMDDSANAAAMAPTAPVPQGMSVAEAASKGLGDEEADAGTSEEVSDVVTPDQHMWQERFRPRKPRYFHRVKSGWAWNHYNKAHYDRDTPPPKVVQGYKFTLFYPELINKFDTPTYYLEPADTPEFAIIRFHAGPPYQDVAFKIVNKEWNLQPKHGFKCQFDKGILTLWFQFKLDRYRR